MKDGQRLYRGGGGSVVMAIKYDLGVIGFKKISCSNIPKKLVYSENVNFLGRIFKFLAAV